MNKKDLYTNVNASLFAMCKEIVDDFALEFKTFDLDSHASLDDLPNHNIISVIELSLREESKALFSGYFMVALSTTHDDSDLDLLRPAVSQVWSRIQTDDNYPLVDSETGAGAGRIIIQPGSEILPVSPSKSRPLQLIEVAFSVVPDTFSNS